MSARVGYVINISIFKDYRRNMYRLRWNATPKLYFYDNKSLKYNYSEKWWQYFSHNVYEKMAITNCQPSQNSRKRKEEVPNYKQICSIFSIFSVPDRELGVRGEFNTELCTFTNTQWRKYIKWKLIIVYIFFRTCIF